MLIYKVMGYPQGTPLLTSKFQCNGVIKQRTERIEDQLVTSSQGSMVKLLENPDWTLTMMEDSIAFHTQPETMVTVGL